MSAFIHDHFLLQTKTARRLYHEVAAAQPILDYHCHLDPHDLASDRRFENVAQLWVTSDPYKHRAMRIAGVPERAITGDATDREKFGHWAATVPKTLGNPLYHWTALELKRSFGIDEPLNPHTADEIWTRCNERLAESRYRARGLLEQRGVTTVCTSDRLLDDLSPHATLANADGKLRVLPSLRADDVVAFEAPDYLSWVQQLAERSGTGIHDLATFRAAVERRLDAFAAAGCRLADHALDDFEYTTVDESEAARLFRQVLRREILTAAERMRLRSGVLRFLGTAYAERRWILQLHLGAHRRTSSRLRRAAGPAGGYAGIGRRTDIASLCRWLDDLENVGRMPRILLYPSNPADFASLAVLAGAFVEEGVAGKVQLGPAWWFNDHATGIRAQLDAIANYGLLSVFIGMTTDSRSLLSMTRHEYFRRVFCDWLGGHVEGGEFPADDALLTSLVQAVAVGNARAALAL